MEIPNNQVALAYDSLRKTLFSAPAFYSKIDVFVMLNNELDIDEKFLRRKEVDNFYDSAAINFRGQHITHVSARIAALRCVLNRLWHSLSSEIRNSAENDPLKKYYNIVGNVIDDSKYSNINKNEEVQFSVVRQEWLKQAKEQIIFNYEPAEIGPDNDIRAKQLRRDLVQNLGLAVYTTSKRKRDLVKNYEIKCNYVFVVPEMEKGRLLWMGIVKELYRSLTELVEKSDSLNLSCNEIFDLSLLKISRLCLKKYTILGNSIFDCLGSRYPQLKPINVYVADPEFCWAPTVVLTKTKNSDNAGFVMFRDEDINVAQMTKKSIQIWCTSVLKIFSCDHTAKEGEDNCKAKMVPWSEEDARNKMTEIISSSWPAD